MSEDERIQDFALFFLSQGYDFFSNPKTVSPYRNTEDNTTDGANTIIQRGLVYGSKMYGLGQASSVSTVTTIYEKTSISGAWAASTSGNDASGARDSNCFIQYEGLLYGFANLTRIWAYNIGTPAFTATALNLTAYTTAAQGLVTRDGLLLMPYDNKIAVKNSGSDATSNWETARLTLPATLVITDIEEWGDQVGILCKPLNANNVNSFLFIWDKVSADVTEVVDLGVGDAQILANIDGELVAVMTVGGGGSAFHFKERIVTKLYLGGKATQTVHEILTDGTDLAIQGRTTKVRTLNRVEFAMKATFESTTYHSMWMIGRQKTGYPLFLTLSQKINNDTLPTTVDGAWKWGDYFHFAINSGTVIRTNNDNTYSATSIYISQKLNGEHLIRRHPGRVSELRKQLLFVGLNCLPLPAGSSITLAYRTDSNTSWTNIFTFTDLNGQVKQSATNSDGTDFPNFYEIQFKITQTGGTALPAEWLSIDGQMEMLDSDVADD